MVSASCQFPSAAFPVRPWPRRFLVRCVREVGSLLEERLVLFDKFAVVFLCFLGRRLFFFRQLGRLTLGVAEVAYEQVGPAVAIPIGHTHLGPLAVAFLSGLAGFALGGLTLGN